MVSIMIKTVNSIFTQRLPWILLILMATKGLLSNAASRKGSKKKSREKYGLLPNPGGGSPRVMKKPNCFFGKVFFQ